MQALHSGTNSVIYDNPEVEHVLDLSCIGMLTREDTEIRIYQDNHLFQIGDAVFYDVKNKKFSKALAINNIDSEVCGLISEIPTSNEFILLTEGFLKTDRYKYHEGSVLYLSEVMPGFLMSAEPTGIVKQIAIQKTDGIQIDIQMGYFLQENSTEVSLEPYTKDELDDIILNIKG